MPGHSSIRLLLHPRARAELLEATRYYREKKPEVAAAFLKEVRRCGELIRLYPDVSPAALGKGVRRKLLRRFPYNLIYAIEPDRIRILAVEHHKRRPGFWSDRL
jgi:toxin ParE1/3/4